MDVKTVAIIITAALLLFVIELIRRHKMTFKYSLAWLGACAAVLFFAINDRLLFKVSESLGFALPSNFIFFSLLFFFVCLTLLLTVYINEQNSRAERLGQAVGILELKVRKLESTGSEDR